MSGRVWVVVGALGLAFCAPTAQPPAVRPPGEPDASPLALAPMPPDADDSTADVAVDAAATPDANEPFEAAARPAAAPTLAATGAAAPCTASKKVRWLPAAQDAWTVCGKDAHCVIVPDRCCSCGTLPASAARAVNRPTAAGSPYCPPGTGCPRCASFPNPDVEAVCLSGRCRAREVIDPCQPREPRRRVRDAGPI